MILNKKNYDLKDYIVIPLKVMPVQAIMTVLSAVVNGIIPAYQTLVTAFFIDAAMSLFMGKTVIHSVLLPFILMLSYVLVTNMMPLFLNVVTLSGKNRMDLVLKEELLTKEASLAYQYSENKDAQDLIYRVNQEATDVFMEGFNNYLSAVSLVISVVSLLAIVMKSTVSGGVTILILSIPLIFLSRKTGKKNYEMSVEAKEIQRKTDYLSEVLTSREYAKERLLFGYSGHLQETYANLYDQSSTVKATIERKTYANVKVGSLSMLAIVAVFTALLIPSVYQGRMSIGIFISLVNVLINLIHRMGRQLASVMSCFSRMKGYLRDFNQFMTLAEKEGAQVEKIELPGMKIESIEFKEVSFKFPGTTAFVLKNCSFVLRGDASYALVGENGAGKSTIVKLLMGHYDEYEGEILINRKKLRAYGYQEIKSMMALVFQDFLKLELSIKENIVIGSHHAYSSRKMAQVLKIAGLDKLVERCGEGLETPLGKIHRDGIELSGGEWQKIAIARLLYGDGLINILDEPTASLDPIAESIVYKEFHSMNKERFTLSITHRLGAAKMADTILVLSDGKIEEMGSHEALLSHKALYYDMYQSQKSWYEEPADT